MFSKIDKEKLEERQTVRLEVLKAMFDETVRVDKNIKDGWFSAAYLAPKLQLNVSSVDAALHYLRREGLIESTGASGRLRRTFRLTHEGLVEIEQAIEHPDQRTRHFTLAVIKHFHAPVGSVQTGPNATANVEQRTE